MNVAMLVDENVHRSRVSRWKDSEYGYRKNQPSIQHNRLDLNNQTGLDSAGNVGFDTLVSPQ